MGTFPDTEIDWHDVIFDYSSELTLTENRIKGNWCRIKQCISQEEVQL